MTDKEQIEEMWKDTISQLEKMPNIQLDTVNCDIRVLQALYNAGYRKIDNDRYLDRKEYAKFFRTALEGCAEENIKSTAKEILQSLYNRCYERAKANGGKACDVIPIDILQFAEKYGVEIEE